MGVVVPKTAVTRRNVEGAAGREGWRNVEGGGEEVRACVGRVYRPVKERMRRGKRLVGWRRGGGGEWGLRLSGESGYTQTGTGHAPPSRNTHKNMIMNELRFLIDIILVEIFILCLIIKGWPYKK